MDPLHQTDYHWPSVARYNRFIKHFAGYDMTTMAEFQILLGVILGFQMLVRFGMNRINRIVQVLSKRIHKDPQGLWDEDLRSIHLPFFEEILYKIDKVLLRFDALLAYSHSVTVGQFSYQFGKDLSKKIMKELIKGTTLEEKSSIPKIGNYKAIEDDILKQQMKSTENPDLEELMKQKENLKNRFLEVDKKLEEVFKIEMGTFKQPSLDDFELEESVIEKEIEEKDELDEVDETMRDLENDLGGPGSPGIGKGRSILRNKLDRSNSRMKSKNNVSFANNVKGSSLDKSKSRKSSRESKRSSRSKKDKKKKSSRDDSRDSRRSKKSKSKSRDASRDSRKSKKSKKGSRDRSRDSKKSKKDSKKKSRDRSKDSKRSKKSKKSKGKKR